MIDGIAHFLNNAPEGCLWYLFVFVAGLFFPQVRLGDLRKVFTSTDNGPKSRA